MTGPAGFPASSSFSRARWVRCWASMKAMVSACATEQVCGRTRLTPTAMMRSSGPNTAAPNGPPLRASMLRRDSSIASATLSSSEG